MEILRLPEMGANTGEAEVVVWHKQPGDPVERGETLLEVQSDKANVEVEASAAGTLARIVAEEGALVNPGDPLAVIALPGEDPYGAAVDAALGEIGWSPR